MRYPLAPSIAWRYLFSKKSHSAVTAISVVSLVGVAIATAAIICVLSVYNGFHELLSDKLDRLQPDVVVLPQEGKVIANADSLAEMIAAMKGVETAMPAIMENALAIYDSREMPVMLKGVREKDWQKITSIDSLIVSGTQFALTDSLAEGGQNLYYDPDMQEYIDLGGDVSYSTAISVGVAMRLGIQGAQKKLFLFAPRRIGRVNPANPLSSFLRDSLAISSVWQSQQNDFDKDMVVTDLEVARRLFQYTTEGSRIEVKGKEGINPSALAQDIRNGLGDGWTIKDKFQQNEVNYRMVEIEKWVTFLLLAFILLIASFNIISTLSMLILEKQDSLSTLHSLGMDRKRIGMIFCWESVFVTLLGAFAGVVLGVVLCLLQQHFGLIKLNGDPSTLVISEYPVVLKALDVLMVFIPIGLIGMIAAWLSDSFARGRIGVRVSATDA